MSGIRSRDTKPERLIRSELHKAGFRFRLRCNTPPGRPDIVLPKFRVAIHVHGCFWHGHGCQLFKYPATRRDFWKAKFRQNRRRDSVIVARTLAAGWRHLTIWECAFRGPAQLGLPLTLRKAVVWIKGSRSIGRIRGRE